MQMSNANNQSIQPTKFIYTILAYFDCSLQTGLSAKHQSSMNDYVERLAMSAVRCTGQPCAISPQLEDFCSLPNILKPMPRAATDYRLILYVGFIDPTDIEITFPGDKVIKVHIQHGMKAVDETSHRKSAQEVPAIVLMNGIYTLIHSRDECNISTLPANVEEYSLAAHLTQDGYLVVHSRALTTKVTGFSLKRLVPVKVCYDLAPSPSLLDLKAKSRELLEGAAVLFAEVDSLCPEHSEVVDSIKVGTDVDEGKPSEPYDQGKGEDPKVRSEQTLTPSKRSDLHAADVPFDSRGNREYSIGANPPDSVDRSKEVSENLYPRSYMESLEENRIPEPIFPLRIDSSGPSDRIESESQSLPKENLHVQQEDVEKRNACVEDESSSLQDNYSSAEDQTIVTHARAPSLEKQEKAVKLSAVEPESSNREPVSKVGSPNTRMADEKKHEDAMKNKPEITCLGEKDAKYEEPTTEELCLEKDDQSKENSTGEKLCLEEKGDESKEKSTEEISSLEGKGDEGKEKSTEEISSLEENSMVDIPALETGDESEGKSTEETLSLKKDSEKESTATAEEPSFEVDVNKKHSSKDYLIEKNTKSEELPTMKLRKSTEELRLERKSDESKEIFAEESSLEKNVYSKDPSTEMEVSLGKDIERKEPSSEEESSLEKNVDSKEQSSEKETGPDKESTEEISSLEEKGDESKEKSTEEISSLEENSMDDIPALETGGEREGKSTEKTLSLKKDSDESTEISTAEEPSFGIAEKVSSEEKSSIEKYVCSKELSTEKETGPKTDIETKEISAEVLVSKSGLEKDSSGKDHSIGDTRSLRKRTAKKEKSSAEEAILKKDSISKQVSSREELSFSMDDSSISESQKAIGCESGSSDLDKTYTKDDLSKAHDPSTKKTLTKDKECPQGEQSIEVNRGDSEEKATTSSRRDSDLSTRSSRRSSKECSGTEPESSDQESQPETRSGKAKEEKSRSEATKMIPKRAARLLQKTVSSKSSQPPDSPAKSTRSTTRGGAIRGEREEPVTPSKRAAKERAASRSLLSSTKPKEDSKRKKP